MVKANKKRKTWETGSDGQPEARQLAKAIRKLKLPGIKVSKERGQPVVTVTSEGWER
jgi:hypothetical protein